MFGRATIRLGIDPHSSSDYILLCWNSQHYQIVVWFVFRMLCLSAYVMVITHFLSTSGVRSLTRPRIWWHACLWLILVAASQRRTFSIILGSRTVSRSANKCYCQLPNGKMTKKDPTSVILCSNGDDSFLYHTARNSQNFILKIEDFTQDHVGSHKVPV